MKFTFSNWLHFHTSDYYVNNFWRDTKFKIANYFDPPPIMEKGEDFGQYLDRIKIIQALRISKYFSDKWQETCRLMNRVDLHHVSGRLQNKMYKQRMETFKNAKTLEKVYDEVLKRKDIEESRLDSKVG